MKDTYGHLKPLSEKHSFREHVERSLIRFLAAILARRNPYLANTPVLEELIALGAVRNCAWNSESVMRSLVWFLADDRAGTLSAAGDGCDTAVFLSLPRLLRDGDSLSALKLISAALSVIIGIQIVLREKGSCVAMDFGSVGPSAGFGPREARTARLLTIHYLTALTRTAFGDAAILSVSSPVYADGRRLAKVIDASKVFIANRAELCLDVSALRRHWARPNLPQ